MRTLILATFALLATACTPMTSPTPEPATTLPGQSAEATSCAARGGEIRRVGRMQSQQCIILYSDAARPCTDGDQCQGDCRLGEKGERTPGAAATGQCQVDSDRFGCNTTIENGRVENTLCVD